MEGSTVLTPSTLMESAWAIRPATTPLPSRLTRAWSIYPLCSRIGPSISAVSVLPQSPTLSELLPHEVRTFFAEPAPTVGPVDWPPNRFGPKLGHPSSPPKEGGPCMRSASFGTKLTAITSEQIRPTCFTTSRGRCAGDDDDVLTPCRTPPYLYHHFTREMRWWWWCAYPLQDPHPQRQQTRPTASTATTPRHHPEGGRESYGRAGPTGSAYEQP